MGRNALTNEQKRAARERISEAAVAVYAERGPKGTTMRAVAERLGVAPSWLYLHFHNRFDLLTSVWQNAVAQTMDEIRLVMDAESDPVVRLRLLLFGYAQFAWDNPEVFRGAFLAVMSEGQNPEPKPKSALIPYVEMLVATVEEGQRGGTIVALASDLLAQTLWSAIHGAVALPINLSRFQFRTSAELVDAQINLLINAVTVKQIGGVTSPPVTVPPVQCQFPPS